MRVRSHTRGFTLIELLVVISIIGLLASISLSSVNEARVKARDTKRIQDLQSIRTALELYYSDHGHYPIITPGGFHSSFTELNYDNSNLGWGNSHTGAGIIPVSLKTELEPTYLPALPLDPVNTPMPAGVGNGMGFIPGPATMYYGYAYISNDDGSAYDLFTMLESEHSLRCEVRDYILHTDELDSIVTAPYGTGLSACVGSGIENTNQNYSGHISPFTL